MAKQYKRGKQLTAAVGSLRMDNDVGKVTTGFFDAVVPLLKENGEPVQSRTYGNDLFHLKMRDLQTEEEMIYWADGGIRGALKMAKVLAGTAIEIVHTGQKKIEDGTVQTYDIFALEG